MGKAHGAAAQCFSDVVLTNSTLQTILIRLVGVVGRESPCKPHKIKAEYQHIPQHQTPPPPPGRQQRKARAVSREKKPQMPPGHNRRHPRSARQLPRQMPRQSRQVQLTRKPRNIPNIIELSFFPNILINFLLYC
jgi:hypothetical protein